jgi:hypothetical protein
MKNEKKSITMTTKEDEEVKGNLLSKAIKEFMEGKFTNMD